MKQIKPLNRPVKSGEFICKLWFAAFAAATWIIVVWMLYLAVTA